MEQQSLFLYEKFFLNKNIFPIDKIFVIVYDVDKGGEELQEIERLQNNLLLIRRAAGWTAEELGARIGVTRQTINNLEAKRNKLNKTQYIAIRTVLDAEMAQSSEDMEMLRYLLEVFVDHPEKYKQADREALLEKANMLTPSILAGTTSRKAVSKELVKTVVAFTPLATPAAAATIMPGIARATIGAEAAVSGISAWLIKALKDK